MNKFEIRKFDPSEQPGFDLPINFHVPEQPLIIEIGCGVGMHPIKYAKLNPNSYIVAIEHTRNKFSTFKNSLSQEVQPIENLLAINANAITWVSKFIPADTVQEYFLLYPNPWPKESQRNQRWHQMPFMRHMISTLKDKGKITIATNMAFYAAEAEEYMTKAWGLKLVEKTSVSAKMSGIGDYFPRTHFEKKYLLRGEECFNLVFSK